MNRAGAEEIMKNGKKLTFNDKPIHISWSREIKGKENSSYHRSKAQLLGNIQVNSNNHVIQKWRLRGAKRSRMGLRSRFCNQRGTKIRKVGFIITFLDRNDKELIKWEDLNIWIKNYRDSMVKDFLLPESIFIKKSINIPPVVCFGGEKVEILLSETKVVEESGRRSAMSGLFDQERSANIVEQFSNKELYFQLDKKKGINSDSEDHHSSPIDLRSVFSQNTEGSDSTELSDIDPVYKEQEFREARTEDWSQRIMPNGIVEENSYYPINFIWKCRDDNQSIEDDSISIIAVISNAKT
ncbi:hypothetical protein AgCh_032275 [Apium graveolens]